MCLLGSERSQELKKVKPENQAESRSCKALPSTGWYWEQEGQNMVHVLQRLLHLLYCMGLEGFGKSAGAWELDYCCSFS